MLIEIERQIHNAQRTTTNVNDVPQILLMYKVTNWRNKYGHIPISSDSIIQSG